MKRCNLGSSLGRFGFDTGPGWFQCWANVRPIWGRCWRSRSLNIPRHFTHAPGNLPGLPWTLPPEPQGSPPTPHYPTHDSPPTHKHTPRHTVPHHEGTGNGAMRSQVFKPLREPSTQTTWWGGQERGGSVEPLREPSTQTTSGRRRSRIPEV